MVVTNAGDCAYQIACSLVWNLVFSSTDSGDCIIDRLKLSISLGEYHF